MKTRAEQIQEILNSSKISNIAHSESKNNTPKIFINIPSYKDPEIWLTIDNFIKNAKNPERVFFGVTLQSEDIKEDYRKLRNYTNVSMDIVEPGSIVGCQPARKNSHKFYKNEEYYLNMDSHMRSIKNWDEEIIKEYELNKAEYGISVFTCYAPPYDLLEDGTDSLTDTPANPTFYMSDSNVESFYEKLVPQFTPQYSMPGKNVLSPYVSGHFFFTERHVIEKVPFMSEITFTEEEPLMALRFFTAGFNLVTPQKVFVYHRYGRNGRRLFWEDFPDKFYPEHNKSRNFFEEVVTKNIIDPMGGLFTERSLDEYEKYSGIYFREKILTKVGNNPEYSIPENNGYYTISKSVAIVTSFVDIGRGKWDGWPKRTQEEYFDYFNNFAHLENPLYIHIDKSLHAKVLELRKGKPTYFIKADIYKDFKDMYSKIGKIQKSAKFQNSIPDELKDHPEYWSKDYCFVTLLKPYFVKLAIEQFDIKESLVSWVDFAYKRNSDNIGNSLSLAFPQNKITVFSQKPIRNIDIHHCITKNDIYIVGSSVTASKENWNVLHGLYHQSVKEMFDQGLVDDDQGVWLMAYLKKPEVFNVMITKEWFSLFKHNTEHIFNT
jgi:protein YibB